MKTGINRQFRLAVRPVGNIKQSDFEYREEPIPSPSDGEVLVRNVYLSLDPTNRIWMSDMPQYMPPVEIGQVMRGVVLGVVEESKNPNFQTGDLVSGLLGWQDYALALGNSGSDITRLPQPFAMPTHGISGTTWSYWLHSLFWTFGDRTAQSRGNGGCVSSSWSSWFHCWTNC